MVIRQNRWTMIVRATCKYDDPRLKSHTRAAPSCDIFNLGSLYLNVAASLLAGTHTEPFNGPLSGTTQVDRYQKKHSPTHTHPDHQTSFINFLCLLRSVASSFFNLSARHWQSFSTTSLQLLFGLPLGLGPSTSCCIHFLTHSSSFCNSYHTVKYHTIHAHTIADCFAVVPVLCHLLVISQLLTWKSGIYLNATHPSDHSHLCLLKFCSVL